MTRDEVIAIIRKHVVEQIEDVEEEDLEFAETFRDFGANSLDMLEVVTASMREMNIKVPRAELAEVESIDQLADHFMKYI
ncbi:phosphopantetheine-binding protein [Bradymonas sediminis]|uniref:Acyl carrier protein n=1 Tax=Bradymonas sediminis TaxID=1548548 RepID=A0A2Z4FGJ8_9DELT|nr:phosphopantetheine-binding protein [Bradymonas sediminis]AWV88010.1 acyl carrier protein [Bradymonas sediminis]TDP77133.1 acyl carrier protein [Bradymonas sediminis]